MNLDLYSSRKQCRTKNSYLRYPLNREVITSWELFFPLSPPTPQHTVLELNHRLGNTALRGESQVQGSVPVMLLQREAPCHTCARCGVDGQLRHSCVISGLYFINTISPALMVSLMNLESMF